MKIRVAQLQVLIMPMIDLELPLRTLLDVPRFLGLPVYTVRRQRINGYIVSAKDSEWD